MTIVEFWSAVQQLPNGTEVIISYNEGGPCTMDDVVFKEFCFKCEGRKVVFGYPKDLPCAHCLGTGKKPHVVLS